MDTDPHPYRQAALQGEAEQVTDGMVFCATLQLRTPLGILERDGQVADALSLPEPDYPAWAGIWLPRTKTFRELGIPIDEAPDIRATHIGPQDTAEYLPFLKAFRAIVEAGADDASKIAEIDNLAEQSPAWGQFIRAHGGAAAMLRHI